MLCWVEQGDKALFATDLCEKEKAAVCAFVGENGADAWHYFCAEKIARCRKLRAGGKTYVRVRGG